MKVTSVSGVKVYDLSKGKSLPTFLTEKARRKLAKDPDYARRIELLQDFNFPAYSRTITVSRDGRYILASGGYKPQIKMFDVAEVSLKFERHCDADIVRAEILSDDYQKICLLCEDRTLGFHSKFGLHHSLRIPYVGRDLTIDRETCDMYIATSRKAIFRFNLSEGRFRQSWETSQADDGEQGNNAVVWNKAHRLVTACGQDGCVRIWDPRQRGEAGFLAINESDNPCTALAFEPSESGLQFVVGDAQGMCRIFDIRSSHCVLSKEHPYSNPIKSIQFKKDGNEGGEPVVISADSRQIKGWNFTTGSTVFNIESQSPIHGITIAPVSKLELETSGLIFASGEQERVATYFVPSLGPAPIWASFLESLTEELEERDSTVYDDYRFVTKEELEDLNLSQLLGTNQVRPWMHGYFIDARTYEKLKAVAKPVDYQELKKAKAREREKKKAERIVLTQKVKINPEIAERSSALAGDDRFKSLFQDPDLLVDEESKEFKQMYPNGRKAREKPKVIDSDEDEHDDDLHHKTNSTIPHPLPKDRKTSSYPAISSVSVSGATKKLKKATTTATTRSFLDDEVEESFDADFPREDSLKTKTPMHRRLSNQPNNQDGVNANENVTHNPKTGEMSITFVPKQDAKKARRRINIDKKKV